MKGPRHRLPLYIAAALALLGIVLLIVGIVLIVRSNEKASECRGSTSETDGGNPTATPTPSPVNRCASSAEAKRSGLDKFLNKVIDAYFDTHPNQIIYKLGVTQADIKRIYRPYDPSPANIKKVTDRAMELYYEISNATISEASLKPREKKALYQVKHYLKHIFATPYDGNYYAGDFLMGPNLFCWQPMCSINSEIRTTFLNFKPSTIADFELLREKLSLLNGTFHQYIANMRYGVQAGMVRSVEECKAGLDSWKREFLEISRRGPRGVFFETGLKGLLSDSFLSNLMNNSQETAKWEATHNKTVNESMRQFLFESIGESVHAVNRYLETEHALHCVPSTVSSGLATLPLEYIYVNGTSTGNKTTQVLPTGEKLDGKKTYEHIMPYFTTTTNTPDEVHKLGYTMLEKLYPEVLEIARDVTGESNNNATAVEAFIKRLNESDMFFDTVPIPANESDANAKDVCSYSLENAKTFCPNRWAAMQRWFDEARRVMSKLDPKTVGMFHFNGYKHTTPNCPVEMRPNLNPSSGAQSYSRSNSYCSRPAYYNIPFFIERPGPKFEEWSVNAHEARPGHHTQVQGLVEHFRDNCGDSVTWLDTATSYTAFSEGWGLYAENPLVARDTDTYDGEPFQKYGMLKWQIWRALRLIVDTGLHYQGFNRSLALDYFAKYAWDTSDGAEKEVTRYQSDPGQATAYMIGQLHIIKLRKYAEDKLGKTFNLKDFHFYLLSQGSAPLSYLESSIHEYVRCVLSSGKGEGCSDVLSPIPSPEARAGATDRRRVEDGEDFPPEFPLPDEYF
ncbi:uncharacterized protein LOC5513995 [Nematostella vectensis]|uniref:uncharacterized protein LOC5513995 n=1 Tax=Nematostella vectensis TaxID=45351 RepID=UPI0020777C21|nr:uncharacterized protein LOC5513995 [Nematostella vectensis]